MIDVSSFSLSQYDHLADRIRLHRQGDPGPFVIVEGPDDIDVLEDVLASTTIFAANGRRKAHEVAEVMVNQGHEYWAVVSDPDFDSGGTSIIIEHERYNPYLGADLEAMLIDLGALEKVIKHLGRREKLEVVGGASVVVTAALHTARVVGNLRGANVRAGWGLNFDAAGLAGKVDKNTLTIDTVAYGHHLHAATLDHAAKPSVTDVLAVLATDPSPDTPYRGKDALEIAGVALRDWVGALKVSASHPKVLAGAVKAGSTSLLCQTTWLKQLKQKLAT